MANGGSKLIAIVVVIASVLLGSGAVFVARSSLLSGPGARTASQRSFVLAPDPNTTPTTIATPVPPIPASAYCGGRTHDLELRTLVNGSGPVTQIAAASDVPDDLGASSTLLVRIRFADGVPTHRVWIDTDDDRMTGMWTLQSPVSSSGWDMLVDHNGALLRHDGPPTAWSFGPASLRGYARNVAPGRVDVCLPTHTVGDRVRIAVEAQDTSLPESFLPGVAYPIPDAGPAVRVPDAPARLAFHYGARPWTVAGCTDPVCAVDTYGSFGHVVFGAGLEDREHPGHRGTVDLIRLLHRRSPDTEIWGYVSLVGGPMASDGTRNVVHSTADVLALAERWRAAGATGIFLDEANICRPEWGQTCPAGPDGPIGITRAMQRAVVDGIHALDLAVFANAFAPFDVLGTVDGDPPLLTGGDGSRPADMYLIENPTFAEGAERTGVDALVSRAKLKLAARLRAATGARVAAVDTSTGPAPTDRDDPEFAKAFAAVASAALDAYGFTNATFSAAPEHEANLPALDAPQGSTAGLVPGAAAEAIPPSAGGSGATPLG